MYTKKIQKLIKDYEARAEKSDVIVKIDPVLPTVLVQTYDGEYFFQEHQATDLLSECPDYLDPELWLKVYALSW